MPTTTAKRSLGSGKATINHDEIRRWVEARGGRPACVKGTERGESCLLRIDYPGFSGEDTLEPIEWEEFFETFDDNNLAFIYQDSKNGHPSRFSKLVDRGSVKGGRLSSGGGSRRGGNQSGGRSSGNRSTSGKSSGRRGSSSRSSGGRSSSGRSSSARSSSARSGGRSSSARSSGRRRGSSRARASARR